MEGYIGEIRLFAGGFAPQGWAYCNGATLPISRNQALYSILGTAYGGDGISNFNLPTLTSPLSDPTGRFGQYIICTMGIYPARP